MRNKYSFLVALTILFLALTGFSQESYNSAVESITGQELLNHAIFFASDELKGREIFSPGLFSAAGYIAEKFKRYGLKPPEENNNFYQNIEMNYARVGKPNYFSVNDISYEEGEDFYVPAVGTNTIEAEIVFAGYGITTNMYDSYDGMDAAGKIVMIFEGKIKEKSPQASYLREKLKKKVLRHRFLPSMKSELSML